MSILVMGIGNLLLRDEGAGVRAVEELQRRFVLHGDVEVIDGGTMGIELLHYIEGRALVIVIDVVKAGKSPGDVIKIEGEAVPAFFASKISPHQLGLSDLLAAAQLTDKMPQNIVLFGIEPKKIDTGLEMSPEVEAHIPLLIEKVIEELRANGCIVEPRDGDALDAGGVLQGKGRLSS